jgi:hypothetical protein
MIDEKLVDRVSDRIIDILNDEEQRPDFDSPISLWCGQLLALLGYARTAPPDRPPEFQAVIDAAHACLTAAVRSGKKDQATKDTPRQVRSKACPAGKPQFPAKTKDGK